jgi:IS30 family transposase
MMWKVLIAMVRAPFTPRMVGEVQQSMWEVYASGAQMDVAADAVGLDRKSVYNRVAEAGGIRPRRGRDLQGRSLSYAERVTIESGLAQRLSLRAIAAQLDRSPSTVAREVCRNRTPGHRYRAKTAHAKAFANAARPQPSKIEANPALRARIITDLAKKYSPEQIAGRLRRDFPDDPEMRVHHETIYRFIYLQPRGQLKREVSAALRSGRIRRNPQAHSRVSGQGRIPNMVAISERPDVDDIDGTRIPGHWEGDLIIGKDNASAIGTVVERATGYLMLLHLPNGRTAEHVAAALTQRLVDLPDHLRQSLTWDQGKEMSQHAKVSIDAGINIYFADPYSPWQRPSNENTNGLLRQYFPKGTDLAAHSRADLDYVEQQINDRPRKRLDYARPQELMTQLMLLH